MFSFFASFFSFSFFSLFLSFFEQKNNYNVKVEEMIYKNGGKKEERKKEKKGREGREKIR